MDNDSYCIGTEGGAPTVPNLRRPRAALLEARADIGYGRVRTPEEPRTVDKPDFLGDTFSQPRTGALTTRAEGLASGPPYLFT
jgi:hypothetical protein